MNNQRVDVIIPFYNQKDFLVRCLSSIQVQTISNDIDVTIIDDCSDENIDDIITFFKRFLNINVLHLNRNKGPGYARQLGLDITSAPYVCFIDADDIFENAYAVEYMRGLMLVNKKRPAVFTSFVEECSDGRKIPHVKDNTWIFGKIYSREFLNENKIVFSDSRQNEDKGFNCAVMLCAQKDPNNGIRFEDRITYSWKWNEKSITRENNFDYRHRDLIGFTYNTLDAIQIGIKANAPIKAIARQSTVTMIYLYYRYLENLKTNDYSNEDIIKYCYDFYMQAYKNYGYKPTDKEFKFIKDNQTMTFRKRNLIDVDSVPISFENFILNLDGNI